jgi:XTP/dITP diphosphohydrolase
METIILATSNPGKMREIQALVAPAECILQHTLGISAIEETGLSFVENAILKARHAASLGGQPALADDSGLVVPALNGQPGIYSSRFAGLQATDHENITFLLNALQQTPKNQRQAYFYSVIVLLKHAEDPTPIIASGILEGMIIETPVGEKGFGYDPIFYLPTLDCTLAELSLAEKNKISHRAQALTQLLLLKKQYDR